MRARHCATGAAGAALAIGLFLSQDVRAIAAALVNVTNTAANPVPVRMSDKLDRFARRIYPKSAARADTIITVPDGKYLVITSITASTTRAWAPTWRSIS